MLIEPSRVDLCLLKNAPEQTLALVEGAPAETVHKHSHYLSCDSQDCSVLGRRGLKQGVTVLEERSVALKDSPPHRQFLVIDESQKVEEEELVLC